MKVGDLIQFLDDYWLVIRYDPKRPRTATLLSSTGLAREVPHDEPVNVIANPSQDWPFVAAPMKPTWGPVKTLSRPHGVLMDALTPYRHWLPSEPARAGGSLFLNPDLKLRPGDYLLAHHANGKDSGIVIPSHFGTVRQKQERQAAKPKPERTAYTRLLSDDQIGDDED